MSGLSAHWINDLPNWFLRCFQTLREDGVMIGGLLAGETLHELRISLQLAEMERLGGIGAHISPFVEAQDIASLMNRAGFQLVTIDVDEIVVCILFLIYRIGVFFCILTLFYLDKLSRYIFLNI